MFKVATVWPPSTLSPTATSTLSTVPEIGNETVEVATVPSVPTDVRSWVTDAVAGSGNPIGRPGARRQRDPTPLPAPRDQVAAVPTIVRFADAATASLAGGAPTDQPLVLLGPPGRRPAAEPQVQFPFVGALMPDTGRGHRSGVVGRTDRASALAHRERLGGGHVWLYFVLASTSTVK